MTRTSQHRFANRKTYFVTQGKIERADTIFTLQRYGNERKCSFHIGSVDKSVQKWKLRVGYKGEMRGVERKYVSTINRVGGGEGCQRGG